MAAMKPRTGDGPLEVVKEGRGIVLRMPLEGGGRLVVEMKPDEVLALGAAIDNGEGLKKEPPCLREPLDTGPGALAGRDG